MAGPQHTDGVFNDMLKVLERIEVQLKTHETRVQSIEDLIKSNDPSYLSPWDEVLDSRPDRTLSTASDKSLNIVLRNVESSHAARSSRSTDEDEYNEDNQAQQDHLEKVDYRFWKSDSSESDPEILDEDQSKILEKHLGDSFLVPNDTRLSLQLGFNKELLSGNALLEMRRLQALRDFDTDLRSIRGNDFLIVDLDRLNNSRLYRIGEKVVGKKLMVTPHSAEKAPWSRLMYVIQVVMIGFN